MTMLLTPPDAMGAPDGDAVDPHRPGAVHSTDRVERRLVQVETMAFQVGELDSDNIGRTCDRLSGVVDTTESAETSENRVLDWIDPREGLGREAIEQLLWIMNACQAIMRSGDRRRAIHIFLDGSTSIEAMLVGRHGGDGQGAFWAAMRTATGRWIEAHPGAAGLPIVVDGGMVVDGLAAIVLAGTPDFPPLLRLNTSIVRYTNRHAVNDWVETTLASGRPVATLNYEDMQTLPGITLSFAPTSSAPRRPAGALVGVTIDKVEVPSGDGRAAQYPGTPSATSLARSATSTGTATSHGPKGWSEGTTAAAIPSSRRSSTIASA